MKRQQSKGKQIRNYQNNNAWNNNVQMNNYQSSGYQNKSRSTNLPSSRNKVFVCYNFKQGHLARNCKNRP